MKERNYLKANLSQERQRSKTGVRPFCPYSQRKSGNALCGLASRWWRPEPNIGHTEQDNK